MISDELKKKAAKSRREGFMIFDISENPLSLHKIVTMAQDIFANHSLQQLYISEADDGQFVVSADPNVGTKAS